MKKIIFSILLLSFIVVGFSNCTGNFDEMNTPKTSISKESLTPTLLLGRMLYEGVSGDYQRNYNLYDDPFAHYTASVITGFKTEYYEYRDDWASTGWRDFYTKRLKEYYDIIDLCKDKPGLNNLKAVTEIYMCFLWQRLSDRYGAVPYTGASMMNQVKYEEQSKIYPDLLKRLKSACESINTNDANQFNPQNYDLIYNGDFSKWKKFGYSLMLRIAMRISNIDAVTAKTYAQAAMDGGTFTSINDNAKVKLDMVTTWSDYLHNICINWENEVASMSFCDYMRGGTTNYHRANTLDPRASLWLKPGILGYVGFKNGTQTLPTDFNVKNYANINDNIDGFFYFHGGADSRISFPIQTYSEVLFLKAEAALRNWGGNSESLYTAAINASMQDVANMSAKTISQTDVDAYIIGLPSYTAASGNETKMKLLMTQKWIALFPNGCEAWAEIRRTGYPDDLNYPEVSANAKATNGNWVQRICYPNNEHDTNAVNMPANLNSYTNDLMDKCNWWAQQNSSGVWAKGSTPKNF